MKFEEQVGRLLQFVAILKDHPELMSASEFWLCRDPQRMSKKHPYIEDPNIADAGLRVSQLGVFEGGMTFEGLATVFWCLGGDLWKKANTKVHTTYEAAKMDAEQRFNTIRGSS